MRVQEYQFRGESVSRKLEREPKRTVIDQFEYKNRDAINSVDFRRNKACRRCIKYKRVILVFGSRLTLERVLKDQPEEGFCGKQSCAFVRSDALNFPFVSLFETRATKKFASCVNSIINNDNFRVFRTLDRVAIQR